MSDASERYRRLSSAFTAKIEAVPPNMWAAQTPCTDWSVRDLVRHVVEMNGVHSRRIGRPPPTGPGVDDDPSGAFSSVRDHVQADLDDPAQAEVEFDGPLGWCTYAYAIDRFICFELAIHGWDLARATGQDERIEPSEVARLWEAVELAGEKNLRYGDAFRGTVTPADGADEQARLLAYLGRRV
ncbi:TIGR03086 family metal-binding protein [Phytohabitans flavus]|uniref:TIGR03086 family protein n=1 Tax=Phytohabitans flavus TaxID=1076124 RepID=A0A6F8XJQ5_9ACTN|nr:TIGR03086 family metal-binding protein [Phytohabitans flavus]BCB74042.1 TIGR03086 family protein [Phytohabitans flavus]